MTALRVEVSTPARRDEIMEVLKLCVLHAGASLGAGKIDGKIVICRAHGLRYDVTTGYLTSTP